MRTKRIVAGGSPIAQAIAVALVVLTALTAREVADANANANAEVPVTVGLSEQSPELLNDFRFRALPIDHVRLVVPWDVAFSDPGAIDRWLAVAHSGMLEPLVAFEHAATDHCPDAPCALPTLADYRAALTAFRLRWPAIREWTPWNEPNHPSQPTVSVPAKAAALYDVAATVCPTCTLVAGDLVDSASLKGYFRDYRDALETAPAVWGIHNYGDVTYPRSPYTSWLLEQVPGQVWITETGGIVRLSSGGQDLLPYDEQRAAASVDKAFILAATSPRIVRMYFYNWRAAPWESFDAGLTAHDGRSRPALDRLFARLGTRRGPTASGVDGSADHTTGGREGDGADGVTGRAAPTIASAAMPAITLGRMPARLLRVRLVGGGVDVRVTCPGRRRCTGRLLVYIPASRGRARQLGSTAFTAPTRGAWIRVRARARRSLLRPSRTAHRRDLRIVVQLTNPSATTIRRFPTRFSTR